MYKLLAIPNLPCKNGHFTMHTQTSNRTNVVHYSKGLWYATCVLKCGKGGHFLSVKYDGASKAKSRREEGIISQKLDPSRNTAGIRGVSYSTGRWNVSWYINGKRYGRTFSIQKYGYDGAYEKAVETRREMEEGGLISVHPVSPKQSGVKHIIWLNSQSAWRVQDSISPRTKARFSVSQYGSDEAALSAAKKFMAERNSDK